MPKVTAAKRLPLPLPPKPLKCTCTCSPIKGKSITVFENITVGPGANHDSGVAHVLDGYRYVNYWLVAKHPANRAMDTVFLEIVFEYPGKAGATGLANLEDAAERGAVPKALTAASGQPAGGYGTFVLRTPVIGPRARAIVINSGPETYSFSVYAYATA